MLDIHCHILPGVDDGAPDMEVSLEMAEILYRAGFQKIAASPHYGEGSAGDVPIELANRRRAELNEALQKGHWHRDTAQRRASFTAEPI